jgi:SAM-dependent methyltransferase
LAETGNSGLSAVLRGLLSPKQRAWIGSMQRKYGLQWPRRGTVSFGDLRRVTPVSASFGMDRGRPIDRHYIEAFLVSNADAICGRTLELGDAYYIHRYGAGRVTNPEVLHYVEGNPEATIVADLTDAPHIASDSFDCIIFTQTLQMIWDMNAALATLHRILKPGGVLLLTTSGISKIGRRLGRDDWGEYWRLTAPAVERMAAEQFPGCTAKISTYGNVLSASAYLQGLALEELEPAELDFVDPDFEVIIGARIQKAGA